LTDRERCADKLQDGTPAAHALAEQLSSIFGATTRAILHYGSRAQGRASRPDSAFDFFVIVDSYWQAYQALAADRRTRRYHGLAFALAWVLPPNAVSVHQRDLGGEREAKCVVISTRHFRRECSRRARDHFVCGRLAQRIVVVWSRDALSTEAILRSVSEAREHSFDWVRVFLPARFDVAQYCRTLLAVSFASEVRLEDRDYAETLFAAQQEELLGIYGPILARLEQRGVLERDGERYVQRHPPAVLTRLRVRAYLRLSKLRTTSRLLKHPFLYDGWLDYLIRKIHRSTGQKIELTARERRWPLIFLWPRAFRHLRTRPQRQH
jgi:hypothetical protein